MATTDTTIHTKTANCAKNTLVPPFLFYAEELVLQRDFGELTLCVAYEKRFGERNSH